MTFASFSFAVFFPVVAAFYYLCPPRFRWALLLIASCYFYMVFMPQYILILFALILIDFFAAIQMERVPENRRRVFLIVSIVANLSMLFFFKYFNFFNENISSLAHAFGLQYSPLTVTLLLPLGLSFHVFQSISYVIEVYRRRFKAERHLSTYALYVMFFPQLVAGPIERPQHLLPQLSAQIKWDRSKVISGARLMAWGYFKKLVIADRLGMSVDYIYSHIHHVPGPSILFAMLFFSFQLYTDFSGYTDIARGCARILGIEIVSNFAQPYFSSSIAEFWRRWHMSLSSWFRDYLFTPLGLTWVRSFPRLGTYAAVFITFTLMGLWHGANWTFIVMGMLFGLYIIVGRLTQPLKKYVPLPRPLQILVTFALTSFTWTFFRAPDMSTAFIFIRQLFVGWNVSVPALFANLQYPSDSLGISRSDLLIAIASILVLLAVEYLQSKEALSPRFERQPLYVRSAAYAGLALSLFLFAVVATKSFIYFQF